MGALAGAVPSKLILPATVAAEAGSTVVAGAAAGSGVAGAAAARRDAETQHENCCEMS